MSKICAALIISATALFITGHPHVCDSLILLTIITGVVSLLGDK